MINQLKSLFKPYVRSEADIEAWIDEGEPHIVGKSLITEEIFVVNVRQITIDTHSLIAVAALWYRDHSGTISDDRCEKGMTYDVSIISETEYELQFVFKVKRKFIIHEGERINVHECIG